MGFVVGSSLVSYRSFFLYDFLVSYWIVFFKGLFLYKVSFPFDSFRLQLAVTSLLDNLKGTELLYFLTQVRPYFSDNLVFGKKKQNISSFLRGVNCYPLFYLILSKAAWDEEFRGMLFSSNSFLSSWNFDLRDFSGFFDLSKLEYDYYGWKGVVQVNVVFEFDFLLASLYFSLYNLILS
jgi:hypothetical protein